MKPSDLVKKHGFGLDEIYNEMLEELNKRFIDREEFDKVKEERDDFLKVLQIGNTRDLKNAKKIKSKGYKTRLIDYAEELGLIEKSKDSIIQKKEKHGNVTSEWEELEVWIDKPKHLHVHIGEDKFLNKLKIKPN